MITFTPLSGAVGTHRTVPLAYLLQVDDVRILLDCGSPDWTPEEHRPTPDLGQSTNFPWSHYCNALREYVSPVVSPHCILPHALRRCAPTVDLVLLSHGDLAHAGLYAYAYAHWGLKAPAYTTIPVQAMARIGTLEDTEGTRDEQDIRDPEEQSRSDDNPASAGTEQEDSSDVDGSSGHPPMKYVATVHDIHEAYDAVNTLRYSQPTHLQG
jgi:cleavage and polyadenylation specificity factor subunit 2